MSFLKELSGELEDDWKVVGRKLGLKNPELSNIESDNSRNLKEAKYQMLCKWLQKNGSTATYQNLATAFMEANKGDLAEAVLEYGKLICLIRQTLTFVESVVSYIFCFIICSRYLIHSL